MEADDFRESILCYSKKAIYYSFEFIKTLVYVAIILFLMIGAASAIILLAKLFPGIGLKIFKPIETIFPLLMNMVHVLGVILATSISVYLIIKLSDWFSYIFSYMDLNHQIRREIREDELADKIVTKFKRGNKK